MTKGKWLGQGTDTGVPCPVCGSPIVYNGNNFCSGWGDTCSFAMPDQYETKGYETIKNNPKILATAKALGYERFKESNG